MKRVLGIMTTRLTNIERFQSYRDRALRCGFDDLIVFSPLNVNLRSRRIRAFQYRYGQWIQGMTAYPSIVYDLGYYKNEAALKVRNLSGMRFLADLLDHKWMVQRYLSSSPSLLPHLIPTRSWNQADDALSMMELHQSVMLKPINGESGYGIKRLRLIDGQYELTENVGTTMHYPPAEIKSVLEKIRKTEGYMVQKWLDIRNVQGQVWDFRVLVQKDDQGAWQFTGMVGRLGIPGYVTSNLETGGTAMEAKALLESQLGGPLAEDLHAKMIELSLQAAAHLEQAAQKQLAELGLDFAIDKENQIWLIEANAKPGKKIMRYADPSLEVYERSVILPMKRAAHLLQSARKARPSRRRRAEKINSIIADGMAYLGTPYAYGCGAGRTDLFDCSSFTQHLFRINGVRMPRTARLQCMMKGRKRAKTKLRRGDLVFFTVRRHGKRKVGHVGICLGDNRMLHACKDHGVAIEHIFSWKFPFYKAIRLPL
ncbi:YheC/YheD family protein [Brevibacillus migulae]|uniref:YheC/YheD family protein n=1 Tax=Brevibacillus migulae TaxID=1644114 RepID=UPI00142F4BC9|nr:YheC/YheD family protein [Brevibacillus migulae]